MSRANIIAISSRLEEQVTFIGARFTSPSTVEGGGIFLDDSFDLTQTYIHTNIHTYIHTNIHKHTYIHTYIHTYKHTYELLFFTITHVLKGLINSQQLVGEKENFFFHETFPTGEGMNYVDILRKLTYLLMSHFSTIFYSTLSRVFTKLNSNSDFTFPFWIQSARMNHSKNRSVRYGLYTLTLFPPSRGPFMHQEYIQVNIKITYTT